MAFWEVEIGMEVSESYIGTGDFEVWKWCGMQVGRLFWCDLSRGGIFLMAIWGWLWCIGRDGIYHGWKE